MYKEKYRFLFSLLQVAPKCIADHVNLGLIPSSEESWPVACHALNPSKGGWLHIHSNISEIDIVSPNDEVSMCFINQK